MKEPEISVGIVNAQEIHFSLNGNFFAKGETVCGEQQVAFSEGGILWNGNLYRELTFTPQDEHASFSLYDVTIGINFHWERQETQSFMGTLKLVVDEGKITAINILPAEDYLISVISSEMNATSSLEFLKAHAVVSRSWLFAQIEKRKALSDKNEGFFSFIKTHNTSRVIASVFKLCESINKHLTAILRSYITYNTAHKISPFRLIIDLVAKSRYKFCQKFNCLFTVIVFCGLFENLKL